MLVPIASAIYGSLVIPSFDWAPVLVALLGLYLLICAYCAIGLFMSSLTTYQVVAAVGTLIVLAILNFVGNIVGIRFYTRTDLLAVNKQKNNRYAEWSNSE